MKKTICAIGIISFTLLSCKKTDTVIPCNQGAANPNCACQLVSKPVCGCNKKTYDNACLAECDGITTYTEGKCP